MQVVCNNNVLIMNLSSLKIDEYNDY